MERLNRRSFVKVAGAATGAAAVAATPLARAALDNPEHIHPTTAVPDEPVVAYVRDAARGEVTITAGTAEHTYRDRTLVKRLMQAAKRGELT